MCERSGYSGVGYLWKHSSSTGQWRPAENKRGVFGVRIHIAGLVLSRLGTPFLSHLDGSLSQYLYAQLSWRNLAQFSQMSMSDDLHLVQEIPFPCLKRALTVTSLHSRVLEIYDRPLQRSSAGHVIRLGNVACEKSPSEGIPCLGPLGFSCSPV